MKKRALTILSIDDDEGYQKLCARFFNIAAGHTVEAAFNGKDGLEMAARLRPDFILLDMVMPGLSGDLVLEALYENAATRDIPVCIVSGGDLSSYKRILYANKNLRGIENKPLRFGPLLEKIEAWCGQVPGEKSLSGIFYLATG
ncbi:MAG TPA: hypothetical protein DEQ38_02085 [Elusimicrobia bacterium]|nr:MAG: hypothetical protein A2089_07380 [Elusimicrobia bacterium GWD2_63_28]HCC46898.1 hypothetical protein [Elusimicrobiota bacterium]